MTITDIGNHKPLYGNQYNNLKLFFNTLANNTSFAHKTSKELQKLLNK